MNLKELLGFNLFLQAFDGTGSYLVLSRGESHLNAVIAAAAEAWGLPAALLFWKLILCGGLIFLYALRHRQPALPAKGLTLIAVVYSVFGISLAFHLLKSVI